MDVGFKDILLPNSFSFKATELGQTFGWHQNSVLQQVWHDKILSQLKAVGLKDTNGDVSIWAKGT